MYRRYLWWFTINRISLKNIGNIIFFKEINVKMRYKKNIMYIIILKLDKRAVKDKVFLQKFIYNTNK